MLNVAFAGNSSWSILNFRKNLISTLIKRGITVHVIAPYDSASQKLVELGCSFHDVHINRRGINPFNDFRLIYNYFKIIKTLRISHICTFNIKPNLYVSYACFFLKTKQIINISGLGSAFISKNFLTKIAKFLYRIALFQKSKIVFFQNQADLKFFSESKIFSGNIANVLPGSGIDLSFYKKNNKHLLTKNEITKFVFIGRLISDKGVFELLEAAKEITSRNEFVEFYLYGEFDLNNPSAINEELVKKYCSKSIQLMGKIDDIKEALTIAHCVILPSYREGMSRSLLEASACGIPIIATDVPGCREIVSNNNNGYVCKPKDSKDLYLKIEQFLKLSNNEIKEMGDYGRLKVEREFSVELVVKKYLEEILA